jgi:hypothetical protein
VGGEVTMAGNTLNVNSKLKCPHGGTVQIISANTSVTVDGAPAALSTDQFIISGCSFQIPVGVGTVPSPCLTVRWVLTDMRAKVNNTPTLSKGSVGLCQNAAQLPQGKVIISNTQAKVRSQ